jgi:A/G-specific adenine glycosylase
VASFAFGEQVAAVDVNVARVAARLGRAPEKLLPPGRAAEFNQAAMELGATLCRARSADCGACPAAPWCPSAGCVRAPAPAPGARVPFAQTDRWLRGRVVAALAAGEPLPAGVEAARLERALAGLARDGLVVRERGAVRLP